MIKINDKKIEFINYPNGEFGIKPLNKWLNLEDGKEMSSEINFQWTVENLYKEIIQILFLQNYLKNYGQNKLSINFKFNLITDYLPFSRDDKQIENENIGVFQNFLETVLYYFETYRTLDCHTVSPNYDFIKSDRLALVSKIMAFNFMKQKIIVYPDLSSYKRYSKFFPNVPQIILRKKRNKASGKIIRSYIDYDLSSEIDDLICKDFNLIIIDDICSFGGTFIHAIKTIQKEYPYLTDFYLYTTYDENQEKSDEFKKLITKHVFLKTINFKECK